MLIHLEKRVVSRALIWVSVRPKTSKLPVLTSSQRILYLFLMDRQIANQNFSGPGLSAIILQQNQNKVPEGCLSLNVTLCLDINEQDGFGSMPIIFSYMQASITPALNFCFWQCTKRPTIHSSLTICIINDSRDHRKNRTCKNPQLDNVQSINLRQQVSCKLSEIIKQKARTPNIKQKFLKEKPNHS